MTVERSTRAASPTTAAAERFVEAHRPVATALATVLADHLDEPAVFVREVEAGLRTLADPACLAGQQLVAPGIGPLLGVRNPLLDVLDRTLARQWRGVAASRLLPLVDALTRAEIRELRWLGIRLLGRIVLREPEQAWQIFRRVARGADDWITVDTTAGYLAPAIVAEPYRWAELEQLVYSPNRWERRLVGATIASLAHRSNAMGRPADMSARSLGLVGVLIGDDQPEVQKALSWALRNLSAVDRAGVTALCAREAETARRTGDGHRAWVIRDTLAKLAPAAAAEIRATLDGIRRRPNAPATSAASAIAAAFLSAGPPPPAAFLSAGPPPPAAFLSAGPPPPAAFLSAGPPPPAPTSQPTAD